VIDARLLQDLSTGEAMPGLSERKKEEAFGCEFEDGHVY
jgi:hypothetical protein